MAYIFVFPWALTELCTCFYEFWWILWSTLLHGFVSICWFCLIPEFSLIFNLWWKSYKKKTCGESKCLSKKSQILVLKLLNLAREMYDIMVFANFPYLYPCHLSDMSDPHGKASIFKSGDPWFVLRFLYNRNTVNACLS